METNNKSKRVALFVVIGIVIVGLSFFGGIQYGKSINGTASLAAQRFGGQFGGTRTGTGRGGTANGGFVAGQVVSKDSQSIVVKLRDGSTKIILVSTSTEVMKSATGSLDDISVGSNVSVQGTANTDGSVTAQTVQLRPVMQGTPQQ